MRFLIVLVAFCLFCPAASAEDSTVGDGDAAALEQCLIKNSGSEQEERFRHLLIALLQDNGTAAKSEVERLGVAILDLAAAKCGVTIDQAKQPRVQRAISAYGGYVGKKIIGDALAKLGL